MLSFLGQEKPDSPAVTGINDTPDIPAILKLPGCPCYRALVKVVVPDQGILHNVLLPCKEHQDRELACGEVQRPEPFIEKDDFTAVEERNNGPEGDHFR